MGISGCRKYQHFYNYNRELSLNKYDVSAINEYQRAKFILIPITAQTLLSAFPFSRTTSLGQSSCLPSMGTWG